MGKYFNELKFFADMLKNDQKIVSECYNWLRYEFFPKGSTVFNYGDEGDKFYVILKGSVSCMRPNPRQFENKTDIVDIYQDVWTEDGFCQSVEELKTK